MKVRWTGPARRDLIQLHDYLWIRDPIAARQYVAAIREATMRLVEFPEMGSKFDSRPIAGSLRSVVVNNHRVIYRVEPDAVLIFRVWDCRQDPDSLWALLEYQRAC